MMSACEEEALKTSKPLQVYGANMFYCCDVLACPEMFKTKTDLKKHQQMHIQARARKKKASKQIPCTYSKCTKTFQTKALLQAHQKTHKQKRIYEAPKLIACDFQGCSKTYKTKASLLVHMKSHAVDKERPYKCDRCGHKFRTQALLGTHKERHNKSNFDCDMCNKTFKYKASLSAHICKHMDIRMYKCTICEKDFQEMGSLKKHRLIHTGEKPFPCDICGRFFREKKTMKEHQQTHTGERPHHCDDCGQSFARRHYLNLHRRGHQSEEEQSEKKPGYKYYKCPFCDKSFSAMFAMKDHKFSHTKELPHPCQQCSMRFKSIKYLNRHIKVHGVVLRKNDHCKMCHKVFSCWAEVKKHKQTDHTEEAPWACKVCPKRFKTNTAMAKHARIHTGDKRFMCETCGALFTQSHHLKQHSVMHSGKRPFSCDECGKSFSHNSALWNHQKKHRDVGATLQHMKADKSLTKGDSYSGEKNGKRRVEKNSLPIKSALSANSGSLNCVESSSEDCRRENQLENLVSHLDKSRMADEEGEESTKTQVR